MLAKELSPKEKRRLEKYMKNVSYLSRKEQLSDNYAFVMKRQMEVILKLLGARHVGKVMVADAIDIMRDIWPFKERRLRKIIDGRRARQ